MHINISVRRENKSVERLSGRISKIRFVNIFRSEWLPEAQRSANVHAVPNTGIRKRISLQSLSDATATNRDRACALPDGTTDQDLVSKSANEAEKGVKSG